MANFRSLSPLRFLCYHCIRVHRCLASFHKHPCPLLHSSLLVQQECPSSMCDQWHSVVGHVGAYECTIVMLKRTALRRMVISLLETGWHPMTVFTMSLWTRYPTPCSYLSSFPPKKTLRPSSVVVSPKFFDLISQSPRMLHLYLSISCVSSWSYDDVP